MQLSFIDQYVERARPHLLNAGEAATTYAERVIALLDAIRDAVQTEDFTETRFPLENPHQRPGGIQVESDQTWILELVTLDAPGTVTIRENGRVRWVHTFTAADTVGGTNLILRRGTTVEFIVTAGNLFCQMKVSQPQPERRQTAVFPLADVAMNGGAPPPAQGRHAMGNVTIVHPEGDTSIPTHGV